MTGEFKDYTPSAKWDPTATKFEAFVNTHGRLPSEAGDDDEDEPHLARWRRRQIRMFDSLGDERQERLRAIEGFMTNHGPAAQFPALAERSKEFRAEHGRAPRRHSKDLAERTVANWERDKRTAKGRGDLTEEQVAALRAAGVLPAEEEPDPGDTAIR